jgi:hypothetical protein
MNNGPDHHRRYREAWIEYRTNFDEQRKIELEKEMDAAQSHFSWEEFQSFKQTLPSFVEYWNDLPQLLVNRGTATRQEEIAMNDEADKFLKKAAKDLARRSGYAPLTPEEAQQEFDALPDVKLSDDEIASIVDQVTSGELTVEGDRWDGLS